jgi:hypothetical protein
MEQYLDELLEEHLTENEPLADEPPDDGYEL